MTTTLPIQSKSIPLADLPMTVEMGLAEFYDLCQANRDLRIERTATGTVLIMPPAFSDTGNRNFNLATQLGVWAEQNDTGIGFDSSAGFTLPNGATRSPDASWIRLERWNALTDAKKASFAPICPDFVIELRSSSDTLVRLQEKMQEKMQEYIDNGAVLGFLIDRKNKNVHVYRPNQEPKILDNPEIVEGDPELPGFGLRMAKIW